MGLKMLGNAVVPQQVDPILEFIAEFESRFLEPEEPEESLADRLRRDGRFFLASHVEIAEQGR